LRTHLARVLPPYARPLFLRIQDRIAVTATFKHQKNELVREGFDPAATDDVIYFDNPSQQAYVRLDGALFERIKAGAVRL
jgi:fatty-acyl-CoA synthase